MAFKRAIYKNEEERMTTQKELLASLRKKQASSTEDLPPFIGFGGKTGVEMGGVIQGTVVEVYATTVWDGKLKARKLRNGEEIPQLNLTLQLADGTKRRQGFSDDLLWKLSAALEEHGLEEVPVGWQVASSWTDMVPTRSGYEAKNHVVEIRNPKA